MEEKESMLLSLVATKPPISITSSAKKILTPSHRALLSLLHQRHDKYLKRNSLPRPSDPKQVTEPFDMDASLLAEHVVKRAKISIKLKRKKKRRHSLTEPTVDCSGRSLPVVEYSHYYKQIQKEWIHTIQQQKLPPIPKSPSKLATCTVKLLPSPKKPHTTPSTTQQSTAVVKSIVSELPTKNCRNLVEERHKAEQRSEIYALNAVMKLYEEHKDACSKV